jgi:glutamine cyclotransferase
MAPARQTTGPTTRRLFRPFLLLSAVALCAMGGLVFTLWPSGTAETVAAPPGTSAQAPARYTFTVLDSFPHDPEAFTQGLLYRDGVLFESTGLNGRSSLRRVRPETGEVLKRVDVSREHFAEGLTDWDGSLIQLTWQSNLGLVYDLETFERRSTFSYPGEGWGLTQDGSRLILSDGTNTLRFLDPLTFAETGRLAVTERGFAVNNLNELEMVNGELFANIWQTDDVVVIDPATGQVTARIDFGSLRTQLHTTRPIDVLNGLAWDAKEDRLFVTGKLWPRMFVVRIVRP